MAVYCAGLVAHGRQPFVRQQAHVAVGQRSRIARMLPGGNAVKTEHLARHVKTRHLFAAIGMQYYRLDETGPYQIDGLARIPRSIQCLPLPNTAMREPQRTKLSLVCIGTTSR